MTYTFHLINEERKAGTLLISCIRFSNISRLIGFRERETMNCKSDFHITYRTYSEYHLIVLTKQFIVLFGNNAAYKDAAIVPNKCT